MNRNRLSTNLTWQDIDEKTLQERILNLLAAPSNYETHPNGKIWVKSTGVYLKGRGNVKLEVFDDKGLLFKSFYSIKDCALFFEVSDRTINRRLEKPCFFHSKVKV